MESKNPFYGVHAVLFALFNPDETIDYDAMERQTNDCIARGCLGITVLGLATEVAKLSFKERKHIIKSVGATINERVPFSVTIAGNSIAEQAKLIEVAQDHKADWLILQPPMVGQYSSKTYIDFFRSVAQTTDLPIAIQNAPQYLGRSLNSNDIKVLKDSCPNFKAIKSEDSVLNMAKLKKSVGDDLIVLGGRGGLEMMDCLRIGCQGFVIAPDIAPYASHVFKLWEEEKELVAESLYTQIMPAISFVMQSLEHFITYGKRMYGINSGIQIYDRSPCLSAEPLGIELTKRWAKHLESL